MHSDLPMSWELRQINDPAAFACNKVPGIKCFPLNCTFKIFQFFFRVCKNVFLHTFLKRFPEEILRKR